MNEYIVLSFIIGCITGAGLLYLYYHKAIKRFTTNISKSRNNLSNSHESPSTLLGAVMRDSKATDDKRKKHKKLKVDY